MGGLSIWHWMVVLAAIVIVFGAGKIGNIMGEVGTGIKNFKQNIGEDGKKPAQPQQDASMSENGSLNAPLPEHSKTTINQG
jgi:sec-independent protein translocase protein TatA